MDPLVEAAVDVVRFCVGSDAYRRQHASRLGVAVAALPAATLVQVLDRAHLAGAFVAAVAEPALQAPAVAAVMASLAPDLDVRRLCQRHLRAEVEFVDAQLAAAGCEVAPLLLKGLAYWGTFYPDPIARRVRDIDLLVANAADGARVCDVLEAAGYVALAFVDDDRAPRQHLAEPRGHSAPPYRIRRRIDDADAAPEVRATVTQHDRYGLAYPDADGPVMDIDVELHAALFATVRGELIRPDPDWQRPARGLRAVQELRPGAALAYTASKLELDALGALASGAPPGILHDVLDVGVAALLAAPPPPAVPAC